MTTLRFFVANLDAWLAIVLTAILLGRRCLAAFRFGSLSEALAFSLPLGLGLFATLTLGLGTIGLLSLPFILLLLVAMFVVGLPGARGFLVSSRPALPLERWLGLAIALALVPIAVLAFYPPVAWDGISYHLAAAKWFVRTAHTGPTPHLRVIVNPQLPQTLFAAGLALENDTLAQLLEFAWLLAGTLVIYAWVSAEGGRAGGILGAALWLSSPLVILLGTTGYIDVTLATLVVASVAAWAAWTRKRELRWLALSGVMMGFAAGSKYPALFFLACLALATPFAAAHESKLRAFATFTIAALATAAPWYVRNAVYSGDPLFPFLSGSMGHGGWDGADLASQWHDYRTHGPSGWLGLLRLPLDLVFPPSGWILEARFSGFLVLLSPLLLVGAWLDRRIAALLALIVASVLAWYWSAPIPRYLMPVVPLVCVAIGLSAVRMAGAVHWSQARSAAMLGGVGMVALLALGERWAIWELRNRGRVPVTREMRDAYLTRRLPSYPAFAWLNRHRGGQYVVYTLRLENMAYFADGVRIGDWFGPFRFSRVWDAMTDGASLDRVLAAMPAGYLMTPGDDPAHPLPEDAEFRRRFHEVFRRGTLVVYERSGAGGAARAAEARRSPRPPEEQMRCAVVMGEGQKFEGAFPL